MVNLGAENYAGLHIKRLLLFSNDIKNYNVPIKRSKPLRINNFLKICLTSWPISKLLQSGRANYLLFIDSWVSTYRQTKRTTKGRS